MRYIFLSVVLLTPLSLFAEFFVPKFDPENTKGQFMCYDNQKKLMQIDSGSGASCFDPTQYQPGLYDGYYIEDQQVGTPRRAYLLINPELPAGFLTIYLNKTDGKKSINVNIYKVWSNITVNYNAWCEGDADIPEPTDRRKTELNFKAPLFTLEIWHEKVHQKTCLGRLLVQLTNVDFAVRECLSQHILLWDETPEIRPPDVPTLLVVNDHNDNDDDDNDNDRPVASFSTQTGIAMSASTPVSTVARKLTDLASSVYGGFDMMASRIWDGSSSSLSRHREVSNQMENEVIFGIKGWGIGEQKPCNISLYPNRLHMIFSANSDQSVTLTLPVRSMHDPQITFKARLIANQASAQARFYIVEAETGKRIEFFSDFFVTHCLLITQIGDYKDYDIYFQQEAGKKYKLFFASYPGTSEVIVLQIIDFKIVDEDS